MGPSGLGPESDGLDWRLDDHLSQVLEMGFVLAILSLPLQFYSPPSPSCSGSRRLTHATWISRILALWIQFGSEQKLAESPASDCREGGEGGGDIPAPACLPVESPWDVCVSRLKVTTPFKVSLSTQLPLPGSRNYSLTSFQTYRCTAESSGALHYTGGSPTSL